MAAVFISLRIAVGSQQYSTYKRIIAHPITLPPPIRLLLRSGVPEALTTWRTNHSNSARDEDDDDDAIRFVDMQHCYQKPPADFPLPLHDYLFGRGLQSP